MAAKLTQESLYSDISTLHKSLEFGFSQDPVKDQNKIYTKVKQLIERSGKIIVAAAANEQIPYTEKELGLEVRQMTTKQESGSPQVCDYHFYITLQGWERYNKLSLAVERKSKADFHQTILQNHERFNREIRRFIIDPSLKQMYVFVECDRQEFLVYQPPGSRASVKNLIVAKRAAIASLQARGIHICFNGTRAESCVAMRDLVKMYAIKHYEEWMDL